MSRKERRMEKEMRRGKKRGIGSAVLNMERKRQNARILGTVVAFFIVAIIIGSFGIAVVIHLHNAADTTHPGVHIYVESAHFTNSSGSYAFVTIVKNTGTDFIDTVTISVTETGSTIGVLSSIQTGSTASGTFSLSGVTNNTLYAVEYYAVSGNSSYTTSYPVMS